MADRIKQARLAKGLTQVELAERIGESATQKKVSKWELQVSYPRPEQYVRLAEELQVSIDYLFGLVPPPEIVVNVEAAIMQDAALTEDGRDLVLATYRSALASSSR